jgi:hypothetical protein
MGPIEKKIFELSKTEGLSEETFLCMRLMLVLYMFSWSKVQEYVTVHNIK